MFDIKNLKINLEKLIKESNKVIVFPHKDIDFDAIASSFGVSLIAKNLDKESNIVIADPVYKLNHGIRTMIEEEKNEFKIINLDEYKEEKNDNDLNIICDANKPQVMYVKEFNQEKLAIIDHHDKDNESFNAKLEYIDTTTSSASEIVASLINCNKIKISKSLANILLTGILLDTNRLSKNVTSDTMRVVTKLLESGATMEKANSYFQEDFKSDRKVQDLINNTKFLNYTIALILGDEDKEYTKEELAKASDYLLRYKVDASYAIGNIGDNTISISARSKDSVNVGDIMRKLNGGGCKCSAATKIENTTVSEVKDKLLKLIIPNHMNKINI